MRLAPRGIGASQRSVHRGEGTANEAVSEPWTHGEGTTPIPADACLLHPSGAKGSLFTGWLAWHRGGYRHFEKGGPEVYMERRKEGVRSMKCETITFAFFF